MVLSSEDGAGSTRQSTVGAVLIDHKDKYSILHPVRYCYSCRRGCKKLEDFVYCMFAFR